MLQPVILKRVRLPEVSGPLRFILIFVLPAALPETIGRVRRALLRREVEGGLGLDDLELVESAGH